MAAVREVFGGYIDLDPASCERANEVVLANRYYTIEDDALKRPWHAKTVFLNPPYGTDGGKSSAGVWSQRLISEYECGNVGEAILLVFASTSEKWFQPLFQYPICFSNHRIRFHGLQGGGNQPPKGNAFVYFGTDVARFARVFHSHNIGRVMMPMTIEK